MNCLNIGKGKKKNPEKTQISFKSGILYMYTYIQSKINLNKYFFYFLQYSRTTIATDSIQKVAGQIKQC